MFNLKLIPYLKCDVIPESCLRSEGGEELTFRPHLPETTQFTKSHVRLKSVSLPRKTSIKFKKKFSLFRFLFYLFASLLCIECSKKVKEIIFTEFCFILPKNITENYYYINFISWYNIYFYKIYKELFFNTSYYSV